MYLDAIQAVMGAWLSEVDTLTDAERGVEAVKAFILAHQESRFRSSDFNGGKVQNLAGYIDRSEKSVDGTLYLFTDKGFQEACDGHNVRDVLKEIKKQGFLFQNHEGRTKSRHSVSGVSSCMSLYAIRKEILDGSN